MIEGGCLCGAVRFQISGAMTDIYQCHCSLCRRSTGTGAIAACMCAFDDFKWLSGQGKLRSFSKTEHYSVQFCEDCGSPAPMLHPDGNAYWVPAGLLDGQSHELKVGAHVYVASKADWDVIGDEGLVFDEGFPDRG